VSTPIDPARAPIMVIGSGRSGTTLLRLMLSAHPRIYLTHEASFYLWETTYTRWVARCEYLQYFARTFSFRWLGLDPADVFAGLPDRLPKKRLGEAYTAVMRAKAARYGKVRWGDKTPMHAFYLDRVFRDYPDARVIRIVRDPRATVQSMMRMPWASGTVGVNAHYCETERKKVRRYRDRILTIRLEDLLAEARPTMARVLDFVGEPWDDAVLDHPNHRTDPDDMPPVPWFESAGHARREREASWPDLSPCQVRMIERKNRRTMEELGYAMASFPVEPSRREIARTRLGEVPAILGYTSAALQITHRLRRSPVYDDPRVDALFRRLNPGSWSRYPGLLMPVPPAPRLMGAQEMGA
jgi:hypothetical protein